MSMTPGQEKLSRKLYHDTQDLIGTYLEAMGREVLTDKGVNLDDFRKSAISAKVTIDTVYTAMIQSACDGISEELKKPDLGKGLLVEVLGEALDDYMSDVLPMILEDKLTAMVIIRAMSNRMGNAKNVASEIEKLKRKLKDVDPSGTFDEIMEKLNGQNAN